jgi:hypothetical protein
VLFAAIVESFVVNNLRLNPGVHFVLTKDTMGRSGGKINGTLFENIIEIHHMKKSIFTTLLLVIFVAVQAQVNKTEVLQNLEKNQQVQQEQNLSATLKSASRLFGAKDDLTTVIMIVPSGTTVKVTGSDSTYYKIVYEENEGFIFKRDAVLSYKPAVTQPVSQQQNVQQLDQQPKQQQVSRFSYLENKYGTSMAARLNAGKIWKGMTAEMVRDSWGIPNKINRGSGNNVSQEEWIYKNTWLVIENNTLVEWGPVRK